MHAEVKCATGPRPVFGKYVRRVSLFHGHSSLHPLHVSLCKFRTSCPSLNISKCAFSTTLPSRSSSSQARRDSNNQVSRAKLKMRLNRLKVLLRMPVKPPNKLEKMPASRLSRLAKRQHSPRRTRPQEQQIKHNPMARKQSTMLNRQRKAPRTLLASINRKQRTMPSRQPRALKTLPAHTSKRHKKRLRSIKRKHKSMPLLHRRRLDSTSSRAQNTCVTQETASISKDTITSKVLPMALMGW